MQETLVKNKKQRYFKIVVIITFCFIIYYAISLFMMSRALFQSTLESNWTSLINQTSLPLIRIIKSLLDVQHLPKIGFQEALIALLLVIRGFSYVEILYLFSNVCLLSFFIFKKKESKSLYLGLMMNLILMLVSLILMGLYSYLALKVFYFVNLSYSSAIQSAAYITLIVALIIMTLTIVFTFLLFRKKKTN